MVFIINKIKQKFQPIGEILLAKNIISTASLNHAIAMQKLSGGRVGEILSHNGKLNNLQLYQAISEQLGLPFIDLTQLEITPKLLNFEFLSIYLAHGFLPFAIENEVIHIATTCPNSLTNEVLAAINITDNMQIKLFITSPYDIKMALDKYFSPELMQEATYGLLHTHPHYAINPIARNKPFFLVSIALASLISWGILDASSLISAAFSALLLLFSIMLMFKFILVVIGVIKRAQIEAIATSAPAIIDDNELPIYSILVPIFKEAESVPDIIKAISRLDYPPQKLDVKLIVEQNDPQTLAAIKQCAPDMRFEIVVVPYGVPQTKPRACNYALQFVKGEYLSIYDAEDAPNAQQLRQAAAIFAHNPSISCLQARLNYYNAHENWLTRMFCIEYAMLFEAILPALYFLKIPIPLGGTSNHLRTDILRKLGGWDCFNVTEDADLGMRLASESHVILPIPSCTMEESPIDAASWVKQRTRWIKGYLQTWCVMNKNPRARLHNWRLRGFIGCHLFIGLSSVSYVVSAFAWAIVSLQYFAEIKLLPADDWRNSFCYIMLLAGLVLNSAMAGLVIRRSKFKVGVISVLFYPLYFILHSVAGFRALWQFIAIPYYWDKTTHSVSKFSRFDEF